MLVLAWTGDPGHPVTTAEELRRLVPRATVHGDSTGPAIDQWTGHIAEFLTGLGRPG